jgi:hypothetical protein
MRTERSSVVLGFIAMCCGIYVLLFHGGEVTGELKVSVYGLAITGGALALLNLWWILIGKKGRKVMERKIYKLHMPCPSCGKDDGMRLDDSGKELRVLCVLCEEVDVTVSTDELVQLVSALTKVASDNESLTREQILDFVAEMLDLPEFEEEEDGEEG